LVNTAEIKPCLQLQPFVRNFVYRELSPADDGVGRPLFATTDFIISFNLTDVKFLLARSAADGLLQPRQLMGSRMVLTGVGSQFTGMMSSDAAARIFSIYFTPTGFLRVFGIPAICFTNVIEEDVYACNAGLQHLHERLMALTDAIGMKYCCENFLLQQLCKRKAKDHCGQIPAIADYIFNNAGNCSIENIASRANMSMKTLERRFTEQVGTSPKLYARIIRFNNAITLKMNHPRRSWTDIAYHCGYYDQMHFIKDFKLFSGTTPTRFFRYTPPLAEAILDIQH